MKSALIYMNDRTQIVLTPETEAEKDIIKLFESFKDRSPRLCFGGFYACQGGWQRFSGYQDASDKSVIIVFDKNSPDAA